MLQVLLQVIENVLESRKIFWRGLAERLMGVEHLLRLLVFLHGRLGRRRAAQDLALRSRQAVGVNAENLVQSKTGEKVAAANAAVDHVQVAVAQFS